MFCVKSKYLGGLPISCAWKSCASVTEVTDDRRLLLFDFLLLSLSRELRRQTSRPWTWPSKLRDGAGQIEQRRGFGRYLTHWLLLGSEVRLISRHEGRRHSPYGWHKLALIKPTQKAGAKKKTEVSCFCLYQNWCEPGWKNSATTLNKLHDAAWFRV